MAENAGTTKELQLDMSPKGHHERATKAVANLNQVLGNATGIPAPVTAFMWSGYLDDIRRFLALHDPAKDAAKDAGAGGDGKKTVAQKPDRKKRAKAKVKGGKA